MVMMQSGGIEERAIKLACRCLNTIRSVVSLFHQSKALAYLRSESPFDRL